MKIQVDNELKHKGIQWSFNPPTASNMGGCWERHIRSVRKILKGLCNEQKLTDETLLTLLTQVEGIMNSRPITTVSDDPDCIEPLSPSQLLTLKRPQVQPVDVFVKQDVYARRLAGDGDKCSSWLDYFGKDGSASTYPCSSVEINGPYRDVTSDSVTSCCCTTPTLHVARGL
jgi:hypothetical protein